MNSRDENVTWKTWTVRRKTHAFQDLIIWRSYIKYIIILLHWLYWLSNVSIAMLGHNCDLVGIQLGYRWNDDKPVDGIRTRERFSQAVLSEVELQ